MGASTATSILTLPPYLPFLTSSPLHQDDVSSRPAHASTKDYLATLVLRPGSARDLHSDHLDVLANKQAQEPDRSPVLGSRVGGGSSRGAGLGWGDRDRDRDRYGDR